MSDTHADLQIVQVPAYRVEWKGRPVSDVYFVKEDAEGLLERMVGRYSPVVLDLMINAKPEDPVWELTYPVGTDRNGKDILARERVRARYQKDARELLLAKLGKQRMPAGYSLEQVQ